jgi:hypothetical protein
MHFCTLYALELRNHKDLNFVSGLGEFRPIDATVQLSFVIADTSQYVCRKCRGSLKSWVQARHKANHSRTQSPSYARCDEGLWPNP